jgi:hypothetical protein
LQNPEVFVRDEVGIQAPPEFLVERLGAINVAYRDDYHF